LFFASVASTGLILIVGGCFVKVSTAADGVITPIAVVTFSFFLALALMAACLGAKLMIEIRDQKIEQEFKATCLVKKFDSGVELLRIYDGMSTPGHNIATHLPEGMEIFCTNGIWELYGHPDLETVLKLEPGIAEAILTEVVRRIEADERFGPGQTIDGLVSTPIRIVQEDIESSLRIIFPDANGHWPDDNRCHPIVAQQTLPYDQIWSFTNIDG